MLAKFLMILFGVVLACACLEASPSCYHIEIPQGRGSVSALGQCRSCCRVNGYNDYRSSHAGKGAICLCRKA